MPFPPNLREALRLARQLTQIEPTQIYAELIREDQLENTTVMCNPFTTN
jgi:hypothetical protein